jgi:hypothetical protein
MKVRRRETIVFAYILFQSRKHPDQVNARVMKDPRIVSMGKMKAVPFDHKRMAYGGFKVIVDAGWSDAAGFGPRTACRIPLHAPRSAQQCRPLLIDKVGVYSIFALGILHTRGGPCRKRTRFLSCTGIIVSSWRNA